MVGVRGARRARNGMDLTRHILARADRPADQEAGRRSKQPTTVNLHNAPSI